MFVPAPASKTTPLITPIRLISSKIRFALFHQCRVWQALLNLRPSSKSAIRPRFPDGQMT